MSRKTVVYKTSLIGIISIVLSVLINFIKRKVILTSLGTDILALNSLFSDLLVLLSMSELGFFSAIIYRLYKPLNNNDYNTINKYLALLKRIYSIIGIVIIFLGFCCLPFLQYIIKDFSFPIVKIRLYFILYIMASAVTYFYSYKKSLLIADQKSYILNFFNIVFTFSFTLINIVLLYLYHNYALFLICNIIFNLISNFIVNIYCNNKYKWINKDIKPEKVHKAFVLKDTKNIFASKISNFIYNSTDSIIISSMINTTLVAFYSNYNLIFISLHNLIISIVSSMCYMFGKIIVEDDKNKVLSIFKNYVFVRYFFTSIFMITSMILCDDFIQLYYGKEFILDRSIIVLIGINNYFLIMGAPICELLTSNGSFTEERNVNLLSSILNIVVSLLFVKQFQINGIILGTIIASLFSLIFRYIYACIYFFNYKIKLLIPLLIQQFTYFVFFIFVYYILYIANSLLNTDITIINFIIKGFLFVIFIIISFVVFWSTSEFKYFLSLVFDFLCLLRKKIIHYNFT